MSKDSPDALPVATACAATAAGILLCLRMLADEAAGLRLQETVTALQEAIHACEAEGSVHAVRLRPLH